MGHGCFVKKIIDLFKTLTLIKGIVVSSRPITVEKFPYGLNTIEYYYLVDARIEGPCRAKQYLTESRVNLYQNKKILELLAKNCV